MDEINQVKIQKDIVNKFINDSSVSPLVNQLEKCNNFLRASRRTFKP